MVSAVQAVSVPSSGMVMDASYSFGYQSDQASREESADPAGNVQGHYSYVGADGNEFVVRYSAGADRGFVIENQDELSENLGRISGRIQPQSSPVEVEE